MSNVLIATLGEYPRVISVMVDMLEQQYDIRFSTVQVIYPSETNDRWIEIGFEILKEHLETRQYHVEGIPLYFDDARTEEDCFTFLRTINGCLEIHDRERRDVYLSLAGGRKHTSALLALMPQFHACVKGLYHLHDADTGTKKLTGEELTEHCPEWQRTYLQPQSPEKDFRLIKLPSEYLVEAQHLRRWLKQAERTADQPSPLPVVLPPDGDLFWRRLFHAHSNEGSTKLISVRLSQMAFDQYCAARQHKNGLNVGILEGYLKNMKRLDWYHDRHIHHSEKDADGRKHYTLKKSGVSERVFCYFLPKGSSPSQGNIQEAVATAFTKHRNETAYEKDLKDWAREADIKPVKHPSDLPGRKTVLVATLGETPMVVTQAYALMIDPAYHVPPLDVVEIHLVYPKEHALTRNGANLLKTVCSFRNIKLIPHPLPMKDLDSPETIHYFMQGLSQAVNQADTNQPNADIALLLSGGRKGMSALGFYMAQTKQEPRIQRVYYTTIINPRTEQKIETRTKALRSKPPEQQAQLLFLEDKTLFPKERRTADLALIAVPIIHLA